MTPAVLAQSHRQHAVRVSSGTWPYIVRHLRLLPRWIKVPVSVFRPLLLVPTVLLATACSQSQRVPASPALGESVSRSPTPVAAPVTATEKSLAAAIPVQGPVLIDHGPLLEVFSREACVRQALTANRAYLQRAGARERARLGVEIAHAERYRPQLTADYTAATEAADGGSARVAADLPVPIIGVNVTPFATSAWDDGSDVYRSAYGVAFSRRVFALSEAVRQRLPLSQAEVDYLAAAFELLAEAKRLERDVTRNFLAVQNAQARVKVRLARVADARAFLDNVEQNVQHGFRPAADRLFAEISLNQAQADLVRELANERDAMERLLNQLGLPLASQVVLRPEDLDTLPALPGDFATDMALTLHAHEDLMVQSARQELVRERIRVATDEVAPHVTATFTAERRLEGNEAFGDNLDADNRLALRVDVSLPLDGQRVERARLSQLRRQLADQQLAYDDILARLEQDLRAAWRAWERGRTEAELAAARVVTERARLEAVLARYEAGEVDNLEVTRAKQALDDADVRLLDARINLANTVAEYRALLPAQRGGGEDHP